MSETVTSLLNRIFDGETLDQTEAHNIMGVLMDGQMSQMQAAALLAALRTRGETVEEIIGFAKAMRERAVKVLPNVTAPLLDIVGTGGTGINTFNISTTSMFVIAAAGAKVAKHGNRGVTRKSGAADVLEALGANLELSPEKVAKSIEEIGVGFIFARAHHPAMKFVAPIRADIKARTIFNSLGPLTNPASATRQLMGVFDSKLTETYAKVLAGLGVEHAMVVNGNGLDELNLSGSNQISEYKYEQLKNYELTPEEIGLKRYPIEEIYGNTSEENAQTIRSILSNKLTGAKLDTVLFNAGAGLYLASKSEDIRSGIEIAGEVIASGKAMAKLAEYVDFSKN